MVTNQKAALQETWASYANSEDGQKGRRRNYSHQKPTKTKIAEAKRRREGEYYCVGQEGDIATFNMNTTEDEKVMWKGKMIFLLFYTCL
jgi:hypothetical protein